MATWPVSLPQTPLQDGFSEQIENGVITTQMDQGPSKTRRRFTASVKKYEVTFLMSASQLSTFRTFFDSAISGGANSFTFTDPIVNTSGSFRIDMSQGSPTITPLSGGQYTVSFSMEKLP